PCHDRLERATRARKAIHPRFESADLGRFHGRMHVGNGDGVDGQLTLVGIAAHAPIAHRGCAERTTSGSPAAQTPWSSVGPQATYPAGPVSCRPAADGSIDTTADPALPRRPRHAIFRVTA